MIRRRQSQPGGALRLSSLSRHQRITGLSFEDFVMQMGRERAIADGELQLDALQSMQKRGSAAH